MVTLCLKIERFLSTGAARPFVAEDERGYRWVVKAHGNPLGTKAIYNELIAGTMANSIELPWPQVSIIELSPQVLAGLREAGHGTRSEWAVGTRFLDGLEQVDWPPGGYRPAKDFDQRNAAHIRGLFPQGEATKAFYGKVVFDNWLLLEDTKYDTLFITKDGNPVFLDASFALGGLDWDTDLLEWEETRIDVKSPYLEGIIDDFDQFDDWLDRVEAAAEVLPLPSFEQLPESWRVPEEYHSALCGFLRGTSEVFIPLFRLWVEFREMASEYR